MITSYTKGVFAEYLACIFLIIRGYSILKMRYKTKLGEIGIIARKRKTIHFIEVKLRKTQSKAKYAITLKNQSRVMNSAKLFMQSNSKYNSYDLCFDAITVILPLKVNLIKNAWGERL